jgi:hypothetical protein
VGRRGGRSVNEIQSEIENAVNEQAVWEQIIASPTATLPSKQRAQGALAILQDRQLQLVMELSNAQQAPKLVKMPSANVKIMLPTLPPTDMSSADVKIMLPALPRMQSKLIVMPPGGPVVVVPAKMQAKDAQRYEQLSDTYALSNLEIQKMEEKNEREQSIYRQWKADKDAEPNEPAIRKQIDQLEREISKLRKQLPQRMWGFDDIYKRVPGEVAERTMQIKKVKDRQLAELEELALLEQKSGWPAMSRPRQQYFASRYFATMYPTVKYQDDIPSDLARRFPIYKKFLPPTSGQGSIFVSHG